MTDAGGYCPRCSTPTSSGVCPHCAFRNALAGLSPNEPRQNIAAGAPAPEGYDLLHELGAGAMGVVWLAREQKLDRLVALKFIAPTADPRLTHRLIREGQAAARLHHPHIVSIHALGTNAGRAYLAMDFIDGGNLRQRLARGLPAPRETAELIRKLAAALAHAHAQGVVHRDVKPSNVLLDTAGEPHLADFGLAAPLDGAGDLTLPGQVAGTAAYLAPELLAGAACATPLSDVYGAGAVLYECLTGRPPFVGDSTASILAQLARVDPLPPRLLRAEIPRDLDTICLKCLEKAPGQRYASATELADDLGRFLRGEAIAARPVGALGRASRWCRRNPASAALGGVAASLLLGLAVGGPLVALRLARANAQAATETAAATAVSDFLRDDVLAQASPDQQPDRELKLRTALDRAARNMAGHFAGQPLVEADVRATLAKTYFALGEYDACREQWEHVRRLRDAVLPPGDPRLLEASAGLFNALRGLGKFAEAAALGVSVVRAQRELLGRDHIATVTSSINLANVYRLQGRLTAAETLYVDLLARTRKRLGLEHEMTLWILNNLALVYQEEGKYGLAEPLHRERLAITRHIYGSDDVHTLTSMYNLALLCLNLGKDAEARTLCLEVIARRDRVLGADHPDTLHAKRVLASIEEDQGALAQAEALDREVLEAQRRKLGAQHPDTLVTTHNLGRLYREEGRLAEAESLIHDTFEARQRELGPHNHFTLLTQSLLAAIYAESGRAAQADRLGREAVADAQRWLATTNPMRVQICAEFGKILVGEGKFGEAEPLLRYACDGLMKEGHAWRAALVQADLGAVLLALKRDEEAHSVLQASYDTLKPMLPRIPPAYRNQVAAAAAQLTAIRRETRPGTPPAGATKDVADVKP